MCLDFIIIIIICNYLDFCLLLFITQIIWINFYCIAVKHSTKK